MYMYQRHVESERVVHNVAQSIGFHVFPEEGLGHRASHFLKRKRVDTVEKLRRQHGDMFGHEQSPVAGQAFHHGLFERHACYLSVGAVVEHVI